MSLGFGETGEVRKYLEEIKFPITEDGEVALMKEGREKVRALKRLHTLN